ncbi:DUF2207 domain-containing protein, partial [bacterium]|nr:DUF2207 domain-containing protein [bacterium]
VEERTFSFDGVYSRVFWDLDLGGSDGIEIVGVEGPEGAYTRTDDPGALDTRPEGTYLVVPTGGVVTVHAFHRSNNETKKFVLRYRVLGAAKKWDDTAELYWQFVGDRWETGASGVAVSIMLPNPGETIVAGENVRAWAHGPLTGTVRVADPGSSIPGDVALEVPDLPAMTFVEGRVLFPREWLSGAVDTPGPRLQEVLDEEAGFAETANAERLKQRALIGGTRWGILLLAFGALVYAWIQFDRHGREYVPEFKGEYFREEPADLHPAIVGALWRMGTVENDDMAATIMHLANKGIVSMRPITVEKKGFLGIGGGTEQDWELTVDRTRLAGAHAIDQSLVRVLFDTIGSGNRLTIGEMKTYAKASAQTFATSMK